LESDGRRKVRGDRNVDENVEEIIKTRRRGRIKERERIE